MSLYEVTEQAKNAMLDNGLTPPDSLIFDGCLHRFGHKKTGWYKLYSDGKAAGSFGDWKQGIKVRWKMDGNFKPFTDAERRAFAIERQRQETERQAEEKAFHDKAANKASYIWSKSPPITAQDQHPYLVRKRIQAHGARLSRSALVIPIFNPDYQLVNLQFIDADGNKLFLKLGKAYAQAVDVAVAAGDGTASGNYDINGGTDVVGILNTASINTVAWSSVSTNFMNGLYGRLGQAKADIANTLFLPATHCFMTPTRWEWLAQSVDTTQRPLVVPSYQGPFNAQILGTDGVVVEGAVGRRISGLDTYEDANIPQNVNGAQDIVLVGRFEENTLYESPMVTRVLPQTYGNQLSVLLQVYGYIAFTAARYPNANSVITGSGLTYPPTFIS